MNVHWQGVIPALTTPFDGADRVDEGFLAKHARWMVEHGCTGLVPLGSLGESATLSAAEKRRVLEVCVAAVGDRVPVIPGIAALSTADAVALAQDAKSVGCSGLMVLPPYVYSTDWREMKAHVRAVIAATDLPCMLYNNPVAYRTDFLPAADRRARRRAAEPAGREGIEHRRAPRDVDPRAARRPHRGAVRRRRCDRRGDRRGRGRLDRGARQRVPGRIGRALSAAPRMADADEAFALYRWFLPLLRMDTVPKFVQLIKLAQKRVGMGSDRVRAPRLLLEGAELREANAIIDRALETRPALNASAAKRTAAAATA